MTALITRRTLSRLLLAGGALAAGLPASARQAAPAPRFKVIFDTDPGVDDALALLLLHCLPEVELLGITTTFGNARIDITTRNALFLAERFGIDVPVAKGGAHPMVRDNKPDADYVHGKNGLGDIPLPASIGKTVDPRTAPQLIIDLVRAHPGEVSLVAVGSMNNLAMALRADPKIARLTRQVVIMGGAFGFGGVTGNETVAAEANIYADPDAADAVFAAAWPVTAVGLDVTERVDMSQEYLRALARDGGDIGRFIWDVTRFYEKFHRDTGIRNIYVHDASAVAFLVAPQLFTTRSGPIRVITEGVALGETIQKPDARQMPPGDWGDRPSQRICIGVDAERLRQLYRRRIIAMA